MILPGSTIGILGGGQLGRMMALSAREMGYGIAVLEPNKNSPCGQVADKEIISTYNDIEGAKQLLACSDVVTYEFENIDRNIATWIEENGHLPQGSKLLTTTQDRSKEKEAIVQAGVCVAPYVIISTREDLVNAVEKFHFPVVLKTCRGGYDGKGQIVIRNKEEVEEAYERLAPNGKLVLEKWVSFEKELSIIVCRNKDGNAKTFPLAENIHNNNILHMTIVPARVDESVTAAAQAIALQLANHFQLVGTLAVELFLTRSGELIVNELAPRPHNSGHFTMNACNISQFEQHIRAICHWPLVEPVLLKPVVMVNILGEDLPQVLENLKQFSHCHLHLYGKKEAKIGRKMGHLTVLGNTVAEALQKVYDLPIWRQEKMEV